MKEKFQTRTTTGSTRFDYLIGGGLPGASVVDVFGEAGTGKTQLAFQSSLFAAAAAVKDRRNDKPETVAVAFVDCGGSFRPERIVQIAESRGVRQAPNDILRTIYAVRARDKQEQFRIFDLFLTDAERFSDCRLIVVDDITSNFEVDGSTERVIRRQFELSMHLRRLVQISLEKGIPTLITNSVRYREQEISKQSETAREVMSMHCLLRLRLAKSGRRRTATLEEPFPHQKTCEFEITDQGIP